jgi:hypothetical protein
MNLECQFVELLPEEIQAEVISWCSQDLEAIACASKLFNILVKQWVEIQCRAVPEWAFGKAKWLKYGAETGEEPLLQMTLKVYQECSKGLFTCYLIPETINENPLTLSSIDEFVSNFKGSKKSNYRYPISDFGINEAADKVKTHWIMLSKDLLPGSRSTRERTVTFAEKESLARVAGEVPKLIDTVVTVLMHNLHTGEFIYPAESNGRTWTFTLVEEGGKYGRIVVGGFCPLGLWVDSLNEHLDSVGVACARKSIGN